MSRAVVVSRDTEHGFPVGTMPNVTEDQFNWLSHRMGLDSDDLTCTVTNIDPDVLAYWKEESPDFMYAYEKCLENKREAFKYLVTQLNGKALRVINDLLDDPSVRGRINAVQLLMRAQALLIDKANTVDIDAVTRLMETMRASTPVIPIAPRRRGH
jgi:hypothetical protein